MPLLSNKARTLFQHQLTEVSNMLKTLVANHTRPNPMHRPPPGDARVFPLQFIIGRDDRHYHEPERRLDCDDRQPLEPHGWDHEDKRVPFKEEILDP
jgi:hypothetical protein